MGELEIRCSRCGKAPEPADINVAALVAKCAACGSVFRFGEPAAPPVLAAQERPLPPRPERIAIVGEILAPEGPADYRSSAARAITPLVLTYRWFTMQAILLLFFAVVWNGFLVFWYSAVGGDAPWIFYVFPLGHVAVGIGVAKGALAGLLNTTVFALDTDRLRGTTGPIRWPWKRPVEVPTGELRQLSVLETRGSEGARSFGVVAHLADGTSRPIILGLPDSHSASFVERAIERHLGIVDEPWMNAVA